MHGKGNHLKEHEMDGEADGADRLITAQHGRGKSEGDMGESIGTVTTRCDRMRNISP